MPKLRVGIVKPLYRKRNSPCPNTPEEFNDCTCDMWPNGDPHRHLDAMPQDEAPTLGVNFVEPWPIVTEPDA